MQSKNQKVIAVDIGGTSVKFAIVTQAGEVEIMGTEKTANFKNAEDIGPYLKNKLQELKISISEFAGIGIGAPNGNKLNGSIEFAPNLPWKGLIPLASYFSNYFNLKTILDNDANAAALGEKHYGKAGDKNDFIFITLGTGLGSGIVINGNMVYGHDGLAGEIGHLILIPEGRMCGCGRKGCVETYCSATGLVKTYVEKKKLTQNLNIDSEYVFQKAVEGEKEAIESFNFTGNLLGLTLANCVAFSSPKTIFLFGGLTRSGDFLMKPTLKSFNENVLKVYQNKTEILLSTLPKNNAAFLGAASLIWNDTINS
jgi:glucokinase